MISTKDFTGMTFEAVVNILIEQINILESRVDELEAKGD